MPGLFSLSEYHLVLVPGSPDAADTEEDIMNET